MNNQPSFTNIEMITIILQKTNKYWNKKKEMSKALTSYDI